MMNKKQLKKLTEEWYQKLKASGFKDIELPTGNLKYCGGDIVYDFYRNYGKLDEKDSLGTFDRNYTSLTWKESQAQYYRLAQEALHEFEFKNDFQRIVWQLHAEGLSFEEISKVMNTEIHTVRYTIERLEKELGLKRK